MVYIVVLTLLIAIINIKNWREIKVAAVLCIMFTSIGKGIREKSDMVLSARVQVENYINKLNSLKIVPSNEAYATALGKMSDNLSFTDVSTSVPLDKEIEERISELEMELIKDSEKKSNKKIDSLYENLNYLIGRRKMDVNAAKRGRI